MEIRNVGRSGLRVSLVGLGCNNFGMWLGRRESLEVIHASIEAGVTTFDTADGYGEDGESEKILREALGGRRQEMVIITKGGGALDPSKRDASRRHLIAACERSLSRLGTDWIDLYLLHDLDHRTPLDETLRAMDDLIRAGKIRYTGCSKVPAWRIADAAWIARDLRLNSFIAEQEDYSLMARRIETEKLPALQQFGMGLIPFFPLANGLLTGKYQSATQIPAHSRFEKVPMFAQIFLNEANVAKAKRFQKFAVDRGHSVVELAMSWLASRPAVSTIIAGATTPEQVTMNAGATNWKLTDADLDALDAICNDTN